MLEKIGLKSNIEAEKDVTEVDKAHICYLNAVLLHIEMKKVA